MPGNANYLHIPYKERVHTVVNGAWIFTSKLQHLQTIDQNTYQKNAISNNHLVNILRISVRCALQMHRYMNVGIGNEAVSFITGNT